MIDRRNWSDNVDDVIRSKHYTWMGMGLGGEPLEEAMQALTADIMHLCQRRGISWEHLVEKSLAQFEQEEHDLLPH